MWPETRRRTRDPGDVSGLDGFDVEDLVELYAPDDAQPHEYYSFVTPDWARKWPAEEIWAARKVR
jgi:hypothetical protein